MHDAAMLEGDHAAGKRAKNIHVSKLSMSRQIGLFFWQLCCNCPSIVERNPSEVSDKLHRWYLAGQDRLEQELDIVKVLKRLRVCWESFEVVRLLKLD